MIVAGRHSLSPVCSVGERGGGDGPDPAGGCAQPRVPGPLLDAGYRADPRRGAHQRGVRVPRDAGQARRRPASRRTGLRRRRRLASRVAGAAGGGPQTPPEPAPPPPRGGPGEAPPPPPPAPRASPTP